MKINQAKLLKWVNKLTEKMMHQFPDWITGNSDILQQKYRRKYGRKNCDLLIREDKIKIMKAYMLIVVIFLVLFSSSMVLQLMESKEITSIKKPAYGEQGITVPVEVEMTYKGVQQTEAINITVNEKALTKKEKEKLLQGYIADLEKLILGDNEDLFHISKPLNLIDYDSNKGVSILWTSDHPEIIDEEGNVDILKAEEKQNVGLQAELTLDDVTIPVSFKLKIDTEPAVEAYSQSMNRRLMKKIKQLKGDSSSDEIKLPEALEDGVEVHWFVGKSGNGGLLFLLFLIAVLIVYFKRYDQINKEIKQTEASIAKDLPEVMNKLVLLLNAGLVVSTAFSKIVEDYQTFHRGEKQQENMKNKRCLYDELCEIQKKVDQSNASLIRELKEFSQRSGVRELVRLTAVISDNWNKGSMLAEKLEGESELLWVSRKKRAEEKGRLAETKLTFPLMILLIVLIMVTIAPAMMEM